VAKKKGEKAQPAAAPVEENTEVLDSFALPGAAGLGTADDLPDDSPLAEEVPTKKPPMPTDPEWQDYVLDQLWHDEVVYDERGNRKPRAAGLARVFERVMGPIIESCSHVRESGPKRAVVEHVLAFQRHLEGRGDNERVTYMDVAEVNEQNTKPPYLDYAAPSAATVAEGRALKKALKLRVLTAEEKSPSPDTGREAGDKPADESQVSVINMMMRRCRIDPPKYFEKLRSHYKKDWKGPADMTASAAHELIENLNKYVQRGKDVPPDVLIKEPA
jgi:hypothetical protein